MSDPYIDAIILGIVQGIAEFLPISSSGHLVIVETLLGMKAEANLLLDVMLHVGTLGSILVVYRNDIFALRHQPRLITAIIAGTVPAVIIGLSLKDFFERAFSSPLLVGICLLVTAALLLVGQRVEKTQRQLKTLDIKRAIGIGLFQAFAILPGISRSGSTIAGGMVLGLDRISAATFSFLLAIPVIGGAAVLTLKDVFESTAVTTSGSVAQTPIPWGPILTGTLVSFIVGWMSLRTLLRLITQRRLHWFAAYCTCAGLAVIVWQLSL
ncbi:MAG: undecaprenyl-diphosphate phosphatase [Planctomycetota bacterium]|nr:undecaprenyl-diphosphate phosphatase [Planctomycetota bacterium]MDA1212586.1 undecaprenyl-diphosphate phosphatase [Planctomycetota bacterium]